MLSREAINIVFEVAKSYLHSLGGIMEKTQVLKCGELPGYKIMRILIMSLDILLEGAPSR